MSKSFFMMSGLLATIILTISGCARDKNGSTVAPIASGNGAPVEITPAVSTPDPLNPPPLPEDIRSANRPASAAGDYQILPPPPAPWDKIIPASLPYNQDNTKEIARIRDVVRATLRGGTSLLSLFFPPYAVSAPDHLDIEADSVVADVGAGTGAFELSLLSRKTPWKKLYAVDTNGDSLDLLVFMAKEARLDPSGRLAVVKSKINDVM